jgi:hypothetical protein
MQSHYFFHNYLSKNDWSLLMDQDRAISMRIEAVARRCIRIGLLCPCERTVQHIASIVISAAAQQMSHSDALDIVTAFKKCLRKLKEKVKCTFGRFDQEFPEKVVDFLKLDEAYDEHDPPVPTRVSVAIIDDVRVSVPMRKSNGAIAPRHALSPLVQSKQPSSSNAATQPFWRLCSSNSRISLGNQMYAESFRFLQRATCKRQRQPRYQSTQLVNSQQPSLT